MTFEPPGQPPVPQPPVQQPYPAQQPYPIQPPPVKKSNNVRTILIVVGIVVVLCCGIGGTGAFFLFKNVVESTGPVREGAVAYVEAVIKDDYPAAYDHLCAKTKRAVSEEMFASIARRTFDVTGFDVIGTNVSNYNGKVTATVTMNLTLNGGTKRTQIFPMVEEDDGWKVCEE